MNQEAIIIFLLSALQAISLGVLGYIAKKTTENSELLASLGQKISNAEAQEICIKSRLAEVESRLNKIEIENAKIRATCAACIAI
jgi:Flp pilus assembly protein CpaB